MKNLSLSICILMASISKLSPYELARSPLDNVIVPVRLIRMAYNNIMQSSTRANRRQSRSKSTNRDEWLQRVVPLNESFPCQLNGTKSTSTPDSVHRLRPGDIDVIAAMGDSLIAGYGLTGTNLLEAFVEERGKSFPIGGEKDWRHYLTLPNILKNFNPTLKGQSLATCLSVERAAQFNVAEPGALSNHMLYMARVLVRRIRADERVDFVRDWKMVTLFMGANDFCNAACYYPDKGAQLREHREDLEKLFNYLRDNLPRTIVNMIPAPNLRSYAQIKKWPPHCQLVQYLFCPCLFGPSHAPGRAEHYEFMDMWRKIDLEFAKNSTFDTETFAVVVQPFDQDYIVRRHPDGTTDLSFFARDCFHFSQKAGAMFARYLWNNMLEQVGCKTTNGLDFKDNFLCPTEANPYIYTSRNSRCL